MAALNLNMQKRGFWAPLDYSRYLYYSNTHYVQSIVLGIEIQRCVLHVIISRSPESPGRVGGLHNTDV